MTYPGTRGRYFISDFRFAGVAGGIIDCIIFLLYLNGPIGSLVPANDQLGVLICLLIIGMLAPVTVAFEMRRQYINRIEEHRSRFPSGTDRFKGHRPDNPGIGPPDLDIQVGLLSRRLGIVDREVKWGSMSPLPWSGWRSGSGS